MPLGRERSHAAWQFLRPSDRDFTSANLSMANYMDASRMARFSWRDDRQIRLQVYIRPVDAGQSLRALMDFADPRLILLESSKLDSPYRLGGSRSDLFAITRC